MNSMFSAFDALFVELMGKNLMVSSLNATSAATPKPAVLQTQKQEENASNKMGLVQKTPRFALELDGLHCFETIVRS
ncbi:uncharacterized protein LOC108859020 [Raphanus sativus]|uniref:Uncharacterized protein LOC108859020 n=1 Tax=Raphanus sativus TaxID=3726 RepID=A0A6J0NVB0_RAPSA|nr:uncharacterized protein LOC108859020 [Raphanus sativus]